MSDAEDLAARPSHWSILGSTLPLTPAIVMGIVNVTPDSFSDGGRYETVDAAVAHGRELLGLGATILDVGGESTRPGAERVDASEQIRRVVPVIAALKAVTGAILSIDTTNSRVAAAAIEAGASIVNDVSAGTEDPAILRLAAGTKAGLVLMHRVLPPETDRYSTAQRRSLLRGDPVRAVGDALLERAHVALGAGVLPSALALDPGFGFGKTVEENWHLLARLGELADLGYPLMVGLSRKSFIGAAIGEADPQRRAVGSAVAAALAYAAGAAILRVHDVAETRQAVAVVGRVREGR